MPSDVFAENGAAVDPQGNVATIAEVVTLAAPENTTVVTPTQKKQTGWRDLREQWLEQNLMERPSPYSLKNLAEDNKNYTYGHIRNVAAKQGWSSLLKNAREVKDWKVSAAINTSRVFNEVEVRTRQAGYAMRAQAKAIDSLMKTELQLTADQAIKLLQISSNMELKALGFADKYIYMGDDVADGVAQVMTPEKLKGILMHHLEAHLGQEGTYTIEAEAEDVSEDVSES